MQIKIHLELTAQQGTDSTKVADGKQIAKMVVQDYLQRSKLLMLSPMGLRFEDLPRIKKDFIFLCLKKVTLINIY